MYYMYYLLGSLFLLAVWLLIFGFLYFLFFSALSFFVPSFIKHGNLAKLSGIIVLGVPLEEILWAIGTGGLLGPIYEYLLSIKLNEGR